MNTRVEYMKKDCINVISIPIGHLPKEKAEEHLKKQIDYIKKIDVNAEYQFVVIGVRY